MIEEITFEITNYCPHECKYCSSNTTSNFKKANFIDKSIILKYLHKKRFNRINISGGEPLSHPDFYQIYNWCKSVSNDVVVYSNLITHRIYNANVIDGVYLEANITLLPETDKIHILRRVKQGRELNRPEVCLSRNYKQDCTCNHRVMTPEGIIVLTPCNKKLNEVVKISTITDEDDKAFCFFTEYPCNKNECDNYIRCKEQYRKNNIERMGIKNNKKE